MANEMKIQPFRVLLNWMLKEYKENGSIFGIDRSLFYVPDKVKPYASEIFGQHLATPIGPAAGPHTQLTQNIVAAWLSGGRFIELKTVQIMDELDIPRPCIDMEDEGYNVEWSQELKLGQSVSEYIKAWVLIHILRRMLGMENIPLETVFNMSVGYNLEGIQSKPITHFMDLLEDASEEISSIRNLLKKEYPQFADIEIPTRLTNNVTLSTMHGCPPDEIEAIALYLMQERGLHTTVKLNPTLLGKEVVLDILHNSLGFKEIVIPDAAFDHDLRYERALSLIKKLKEVALKRNLVFGVKLSNTLAMSNHKGTMPGADMYMSGRPLYPLTINLFKKLAKEFNGDLNVSYSAGADALNVSGILSAGALPVTVASDLLKPGGYSRFGQYLENIEAEMARCGAKNLKELAANKLQTLEMLAAEALTNPRYKKSFHPYGLPKVKSGLDMFDCVEAPCIEPCAVHQDVPEYAWLIAQGEYDRAIEVILARNPLPGITGHICTHLCQTRCTRNNYDQPVAIRALKRFAVENGRVNLPRRAQSEYKVAIIGAGPAGLAAAAFLGLNGVKCTLFEARDTAGGMVSIAPAFRIPRTVVQEDIDRVIELGAELKLSHPVDKPPAELLKEGFHAVYIATGFQKDAGLEIEGVESAGVYGALDFLERSARGEKVALGSKVLIIGGGNTAMDAARSAQRLTQKPSTVIYRRTRAEMPAELEEIEDMLAEGNQLEELLAPRRVIAKDGRVVALECVHNRLGEPGADGRRKPLPVEGSEFQIPADSIILAIGQQPNISFLGKNISLRRDGAIVADPETGKVDQCVFAGGDVVEGPATIIQACADGRRAAEAICDEFGIHFTQFEARFHPLSEEDVRKVKRLRARREFQQEAAALPVAKRSGFDLVESTLTESQARQEGARCLQCSTFCDKCVEVCPNRANYTIMVEPVNLSLPVLTCQRGMLELDGSEAFKIKQVRQIVHLDDLCNACGNCATFCVHHGRPYMDKPRLFFTREEYQKETSNAFYIQGSKIWRREDGKEFSLFFDKGFVFFENDQVRLRLSRIFEIKEMTLKEGFKGKLSLKQAAETAVLYDGILRSASFLLEAV